jgi:hypothetical protein
MNRLSRYAASWWVGLFVLYLFQYALTKVKKALSPLSDRESLAFWIRQQDLMQVI